MADDKAKPGKGDLDDLNKTAGHGAQPADSKTLAGISFEQGETKKKRANEARATASGKKGKRK